MTKKILNYLVAGALTLGSLGCSTKEEIIYDGNTSLGKTQVIRVNLPCERDDRKVVITKADTTWTLLNKSNFNDLGEDYARGKMSNKDYVIEETPNGIKTYCKDYFIDKKGRKYTNKKPLEKIVVKQSQNFVKGRFNDMYNQALKEANDSLKVQMLREVNN